MTLQEYREELTERLSSAVSAGFWTNTEKDSAINNGGVQVCNYHQWNFLQLALKITTSDDREYYDYPGGAVRLKPNSIYQIVIADEVYNGNVPGRLKTTWGQFQEHKQADSDELIYANHNGYYFLHPKPANDKVMDLYGVKGWQKLVSDTDEAITPYELDEAILKVALAKLIRKAKKYGEAREELADVFRPETGILAMVKEQIQEGGPGGFIGNATSSRFN